METNKCPVLEELFLQEAYDHERESPPVMTGGDYDIGGIRSSAEGCEVSARADRITLENTELRKAIEIAIRAFDEIASPPPPLQDLRGVQRYAANKASVLREAHETRVSGLGDRLRRHREWLEATLKALEAHSGAIAQALLKYGEICLECSEADDGGGDYRVAITCEALRGVELTIAVPADIVAMPDTPRDVKLKWFKGFVSDLFESLVIDHCFGIDNWAGADICSVCGKAFPARTLEDRWSKDQDIPKGAGQFDLICPECRTKTATPPTMEETIYVDEP